MGTALIRYKGVDAGLLKETDAGYEFRYDAAYLASPSAQPVSLTLPLSEKPYTSHVLFPFFGGLIPTKGGIAEEELDKERLGGASLSVISGERVPPPVVTFAGLCPEELAGIA